jgi:hypothetical protein
MKVIVLSPWKVFIAGVLSCLLIVGSVLGALALLGVFRTEPAEAYGADGVGARFWYFPEGYTGPGFEEWILIYNPRADEGGTGIPIAPEIRMYGPEGYIGNFNSPAIQPGQRRSVFINDLAAYYGYTGDVSVVVRGVDNPPFICERAMYFNYKGQITGGSQTFGYQEGAAE